jgi:radical SAM superfamily enzyme YgiQ (UPF0313 family)
LKITLVFPDWVDINTVVEHDKEGLGIGHLNFAVASLSAVLKQKGHEVDLLHICRRPTGDEFKQLLKEKYANSQVFAFSFSEVEKDWVRDMALWVKQELKAFCVGGGIYPTIMPQGSLFGCNLDAVCVGEGDYALPRLCDLMQAGKDYRTVTNLFFRQGDEILKNPIGEIVCDLDELPRYDYELFDPKRVRTLNSNLPRLTYLCTRNCVYGCAFCANHAKRKAMKAGRLYTRRFSPERVVSDLSYYLKKYPVAKLVHFSDEIIHQDEDYFNELMTRYKEKIDLPWRSYAMLKDLTPRMVEIMAWSGCTRVNCGIEAGSTRIRKLYNRPSIEDKEILYRIDMLRDHGIEVHTSTLLNAPTETMDEMLTTVKLVAKSKSFINVVGIVVPYQATRLHEMAQKKGLLLDTKFENLGVSIKPQDATPEKVLFFYHAYRFMVETYRFLLKHPRLKPLTTLVDQIFKSRLLPHNVLIKLHERYFKGKILNRQYRKAEAHLGRDEVSLAESTKRLAEMEGLPRPLGDHKAGV